MFIKKYILLFFIFNFLKSEFGYVLNNCSNLFLEDKKNRKILNEEDFILSQEASYLNLNRVCQLNKGEIIEIDSNFYDKNCYLIYAKNYFYKDEYDNLSCKFFIEKKNIKILNEKEYKIYNDSIIFNKKAFLKVFYKNFLPGKMFFIKNNYNYEENEFIKCYYFDENLEKKFIELEKSNLEIRDHIFYESNFLEKNEEEIRRKIINYLEFLTENNDKIIPYVYGGTTIGKFSEKNFFETKNIEISKNIFTKIYTRKIFNDKDKAGTDCSGLVNFVLRLFGIPFHLRNTETFKLFLKKINNYEELKDGDLLWIQRHVFIVNKQENKLYESNGYSHNINGVIQKDISEKFIDINSIKDLFIETELISKLTGNLIKELLFLKSF